MNANISVGDYFTKKIANAKKYVYIISPWISSIFIPELAKLAKAGVCVKIITSDDTNGEQVKTLKLLNDHKNQPMFAFKIMGASQVHSKIFLIDGIHLATPSANLSNQGLTKQHNTVTMSTRPKDIKKFETIFFELWN